MKLGKVMSEKRNSLLHRIQVAEDELTSLKQKLLAEHLHLSEESFPIEALVCHSSDLSVAIPVIQIEEVTSMVYLSPLPDAPQTIRGIVDYHGRLAPVLDWQMAFSSKPTVLKPDMHLVFLTTERHLWAAVVDEVGGVCEFNIEDIDHRFVDRLLPSFIPCIFQQESELIFFIDPLRLINAAELETLHDLLRDFTTSMESDL